MPPDPNFRHDVRRAVYVTGEIDQDLVDRLTPRILELRAVSADPITAYIDSPGGNTYHAELLYQLLKARNQDNQSCHLITLVTGTAASAAADLLASGDYSLAYPHSRILYHGTRRMSQQVLTREGASSLAESLRLTNEGFAIRLADRSIDRIIFQFMLLKSSFAALREKLSKPELPEVDCFAEAIREKLGVVLAELVSTALARQRTYERLYGFVSEKLDPRGEEFKAFRSAQVEAEVLKTILDFELKENPGEEWTFTAQGLAKLQEDYLLLSDYHSGRHQRRQTSLTNRWGTYFLRNEESSEYEKMDQEKRSEWLADTVADRIHPLWYLFFSICRMLQDGEFILSPSDGYYLGIVDEVVGDGDLPCLREAVENAPQGATSEP